MRSAKLREIKFAGAAAHSICESFDWRPMQWSGSRELCSTKRARQKPVRVLKNPPCIDGRGEIASRSIFRHIAPREATSLRACRAQAGDDRPPSRLRVDGMGKWTHTIPNYPPARLHRGRPTQAHMPEKTTAPHQHHCFFFVSSRALTVTIVPKIWSKPRPTSSSAQPVRANCVKGLASRCDLRV